MLGGHHVSVETGAGEGSGISDADYSAEGATIAPDAASVWESAEMVVKVKEPVASEYGHFSYDLVLFTYLHLAAEPRRIPVSLVQNQHQLQALPRLRLTLKK